MAGLIIGMHELIDPDPCNFAKYSLSLIIEKARCKLFNWCKLFDCQVFIYIYNILQIYGILNEINFHPIKFEVCARFGNNLIFKMYLFFLLLVPREIYRIYFVVKGDKIKFKMATSNLDITHTFLCIVA